MPQKQHQLRDVQSKRGPQIKAEQKWLEIDKEKKKKQLTRKPCMEFVKEGKESIRCPVR